MSIETNIIGRFSDSGIDIEGTATSLLEFAKRVQWLRGRETFELSVPSVPAFPYSGYLRSLQIEIGEGNVHISHDQDRVYITGSLQKIEILAENIASLALQNGNHDPEHSHIEYFPGNFYLMEGSEPLVLTKREGI